MDSNYNNNQNDYRYDSRYGTPPPPHGAPPPPPHGATPPPPYGAPPPRARRRGPSRFWLFCCSVIPGMGYMYLGLMKRGLFFMSSFFITCFMAGTISEYFGILIPILYIATFFDSFHTRNRIENGEHVPDNVDGILNFASKNRVPLAVGFGVLTLAGVIQNLYHLASAVIHGRYVYFGDGVAVVVSIVLVVLLFYVLLFKNPRRAEDEKKDGNYQG